MIDVPTCSKCGSILVCVCCPPGIMREIEGLRAGAARMAKEVVDLTRERDEAREAAGAEKLTLLAERFGARSACEAMTKDLDGCNKIIAKLRSELEEFKAETVYAEGKRDIADWMAMKCHTALESFKLHGRFVPEDRALLAEQLLKDTKEALSVSEANAAAMRTAIDHAIEYLCDRRADEDPLGADVVHCLSAAKESEAGVTLLGDLNNLQIRRDRLEADLRARNIEVAEVRVEAERIKEECARIADRNVDFVGPGTRSVIAEAIAREIRALPSHFGGGYICDIERKYRTLLWQTHGHPFAALYGDDGEMQCNADGCGLDFVRDSLEKIEEAVRGIVGAKLRAETGTDEESVSRKMSP